MLPLPLYGRLDKSLDGETVDAELNVGMSKGMKGAVSAPAGYRAAPQSKTMWVKRPTGSI